MLKTKDDVLKFLEGIDVTTIGNYRVGFSHTLRPMYDDGSISDDEIINGLSDAVIHTARNMVIISVQRYRLDILDRVKNGPQVLSYAIENDGFRAHEIERAGLKTDLIDLCKKSREEGLLDRLKGELLVPLESSYADDEHPCDYGGIV